MSRRSEIFLHEAGPGSFFGTMYVDSVDAQNPMGRYYGAPQYLAYFQKLSNKERDDHRPVCRTGVPGENLARSCPYIPSSSRAYNLCMGLS